MWFVAIYNQEQIEIAGMPLGADDVLYIGSGSENHMIIPDPEIPPQQMFCYLTEGYPVIEDAGTQSTFLDGAPLVEPSYVTQDSSIQVGSYSIYIYFEDDMAQGEELPPLEDPPPPPDAVSTLPVDDENLNAGYDDPVYADDPQISEGGSIMEANSLDDSMPIVRQDASAIEFGNDALPIEISSKDLKLVAREGYLDGREFFLAYDEYFDIGRSNDVEIVIDDPSVSRVHARLKIEPGGTLMIQDLRSTNGSFINGKEIKREIASIGDRIRIGEIPFLFTTKNGNEKSSSSGLNSLFKSKKFIFILSGFLCLMALWVIYLNAKKNRHHKKKSFKDNKVNFQESLNQQVARLKSEAKSLSDVDQWDNAISKYKSALSLMPDDKSIKEQLSHAYFEKRNYSLFKAALDLKNRMNQQGRIAALQKFQQIDKRSQYFRSNLSPIILELKKGIARNYKNEGLAQLKARYSKKAAIYLCKYFELDSRLDDIRTEQKLRLKLKRIERRFSGSRKFPKCTAKRFKNARMLVSELWAKEAFVAIKKKYYKGISKAIMTYFAGNPKDAILQLDELIKTRRGKRKYKKYLSQIIDLKEQLQSIVQGYEAGETKILVNDPVGALKEWKMVLEIDRQILPGKWKSKYRRNIANRLASRYYDDGKKELIQLKYIAAFKLFKKGIDLNPDDTTELRAGIKELEQKAMEMYEDAVSYQQSGNSAMAKTIADKILKFTMADSPMHKKVLKAMGGK